MSRTIKFLGHRMSKNEIVSWKCYPFDNKTTRKKVILVTQEKILYTNLGFLSDFPKNILNLDFFGKTGQNLNLENIWETLRYETSTFPNLCSFEKTPSNWVFLRFSPKSFYI